MKPEIRQIWSKYLLHKFGTRLGAACQDFNTFMETIGYKNPSLCDINIRRRNTSWRRLKYWMDTL
jgi:hypothetical protein